MRAELQNLPEPQWFHHGERILTLLEYFRPLICVELGTNTGGSAIAVARLIRHWGGTVYCVDKWEDISVMRQCEENLRAASLTNVHLYHADSVTVGKVWVKDVDYLYVDGDHSLEGCLADLRTWWPHVRTGGVVAGDDYDDPHGIPSQGVTAAWDEFEQEMDQKFHREYSPNLIGCHCKKCVMARLIWGVKS